MKKTLAVVMILLLAASTMFVSNALSSENSTSDTALLFVVPTEDSAPIGLDQKLEVDTLIETYPHDYLIKQDEANRIYNALLAYFETDEEFVYSYPDYYGGAYINDDGNLVVYVPEGISDFGKVRQQLSDISHGDSFILKSGKYSYSQLESTMNYLNDYVASKKNPEIAKMFPVFGLSDMDNCVFVELTVCDESGIAEFRSKVLDSDMIVFKQSGGVVKSQSNVNVGQMITSATLPASMGYRAKRNGVVGIVTAGHLAAKGSTLYIGGTSFATVVERQCSGSVDAEFAEITNPSFTPTNTFYSSTTTVSTSVFTPAVGSTIHKIGYAGGNTSGIVRNVNVSATDNKSGVTFTNFTSASYTSLDGDSGGLVYYIDAAYIRYASGIHMGANDEGIAYFSKINLVNSALGITRY